LQKHRARQHQHAWHFSIILTTAYPKAGEIPQDTANMGF